MPVYLSLQNPLVHDFKNKVYRDKKYRELIDQAKKEGRDGVILKNTYDSGEYSRFDAIIRGKFKGEDIYVAFEPTQIKSAIGNIGTFDPTKPDIRYSLRQQAGQTLGQSYLNTVQRTTTPRVEKGSRIASRSHECHSVCQVPPDVHQQVRADRVFF
jgi:hypothetical protein